jgi:hypothetical protein
MRQTLTTDVTILRFSAASRSWSRSPFVDALYLRYIRNKFRVSDPDGDFPATNAELLDGFIARIAARSG